MYNVEKASSTKACVVHGREEEAAAQRRRRRRRGRAAQKSKGESLGRRPYRQLVREHAVVPSAMSFGPSFSPPPAVDACTAGCPGLEAADDAVLPGVRPGFPPAAGKTPAASFSRSEADVERGPKPAPGACACPLSSERMPGGSGAAIVPMEVITPRRPGGRAIWRGFTHLCDG